MYILVFLFITTAVPAFAEWVLLPSVGAMASDVSKSEALKQSWRTSAPASLQEFFVKFSAEIVQLQKQNLRAVVMSHQAKKHAEWQHAQDFFVRQSASLTVEEKEIVRRLAVYSL